MKTPGQIPPDGHRDTSPVRTASAGRRPGTRQLRLDELEDRTAPAIWTVTNTADDGAGSLRSMILNANFDSDSTCEIRFNIPGSTGQVHTISPLSPLPYLSRTGLVLNGLSQPGAAPHQSKIRIDGVSAGADADGLIIFRPFSGGAGVTIRGLSITRFSGWGVNIIGSGNLVYVCEIGTDVTGTLPCGNGKGGVVINSGYDANAIYSSTISANNGPGVHIFGGEDSSGNVYFAENNAIASSNIGTDLSGRYPLGNAGSGIILDRHVRNTRIGSNGDGVLDSLEGNYISANGGNGIYMVGADTSGNYATGNQIGLDGDGFGTGLGNAGQGVWIDGGANNNRIGVGEGTDPSYEPNRISANGYNGVLLTGAGTSGNVVAGNEIGVDQYGSAPRPNGYHGVAVWGGATNNRIGSNGNGDNDYAEGNNIASNTYYGVALADPGTTGNVVAGNNIGVLEYGTQTTFGNGMSGVGIWNGAAGNVIGTAGTSANPAAERNVIAANKDRGVLIFGAGTDSNVVAGNYIGLRYDGTAAIGNAAEGVAVFDGAKYNRIGTNGNNVGDAAERNVVSGNGRNGIVVGGLGANLNTVAGNYVGTNAAGAAAVPNAYSGIGVYGGAQGNVIGTTGAAANAAAEGNLVSGNTNIGIFFTDAGTTGNVAAGNQVGLNAAGTAALANGGHGISVTGGAQANRIGSNGDTVGDAAERNIVAGNGGDGINLTGLGTTDNVVAGNYVGTNVAGAARVPNAYSGVAIFDQARNNRVGTAGTAANPAGERNVISGGGGAGVWISGTGTSSNVVAGNFIGVNAAGAAALGNTAEGVTILNGAQGNRVGTNGDNVGDAAERNVVSGNGGHGIAISGAGTNSNVVAGNYAGTNAAGVAAVKNGQSGIAVFGGAQYNRIGTAGTAVNAAGEGNLASGNQNTGILLSDPSTNFNIVAGNFAGTTAAGTASLPNGSTGVTIQAGAQNNRIGTNADGVGDGAERNVLSGNGSFGVYLAGAGTSFNVVAGNYAGTDVTGAAKVANGFVGVGIDVGAANNRVGVGGTEAVPAAAGNVVSGNTAGGVFLAGSGTIANAVAGNRIGTTAVGAQALANGGPGVYLFAGAAGNRVGTNGDNAGDAAERNVISGNAGPGVTVEGTGTNLNVVAGNYVGTDAAGAAALPNGQSGVVIQNRAQGTRVGSNGDGVSDTLERNVISGNGQQGVMVTGVGTDLTTIAGNFIGTRADGAAALPNSLAGVFVWGGARGTLIGTNGDNVGDTAERNVISGNKVAGVYVADAATALTVVAGNYIGTNAAGTAAVGNEADGVVLINGVKGTVVGTNADGVNDAAERNVISGNLRYGVLITGVGTDANAVAGNYIGADQTGTADLGNTFHGVLITSGASNNMIGGSTAAARNVISGNDDTGVRLRDQTGNTVPVAGNRVLNNLIGVDATGAAALPNTVRGVSLFSLGGAGAIGNVIGAPGSGNVISGNGGPGVELDGALVTGNLIQGNAIGADAGGTLDLGNAGDGVRIQHGATGNSVGGDAAGAGNTIAFNDLAGVAVLDAGAVGNVLRRNRLFANGGPGIDLGGDGPTANDLGDADAGPAGLQNAPVLAGARAGAATIVAGTLNSVPNATYRITFFASLPADLPDHGEGGRELGSRLVTTDAQGNATIRVDGLAATAIGEFVTATAEDAAGNASEFAPPVAAVADAAGPAVTVVRAAGQPSVTGVPSVVFAVRFSEPAFGFDAADIDLSAGTAGGALVVAVAGGGTDYTVTVTGMTGAGTVVARVPAAAAADLFGNASSASAGPDDAVTFEAVDVTATIAKAPGQPGQTAAAVITFAVVFSEPVTGFTADDVDLTGGTVGGALSAVVSGAGSSYTVTVTGMVGAGTVRVAIPAGVVSGVAGNPNTAAAGPDNVVAYDNIGTVGFSQAVYTTAEGAGAVAITLTRSGGSDGPLTVSFGTADATARAGFDYTSVSGTKTWAAGETGDRTFTIPISADRANEGREVFDLAIAVSAGLDRPGRMTARVDIAPSDPLGPGTYFDQDGDKVVVTLGGEGTVRLFQTDPDGDGRGPIEWIDLAGTDPARSALSLVVTKAAGTADRGTVRLGSVTGSGLKSLSAKAVTLDGPGINLTGPVGAVVLGDLANGADILAAAGTAATTLTLGSVGDGAVVRVGNPISALTAKRFGAASIEAPSVGTLTVTGDKATAGAGDFAATVTLSGTGVPVGKPTLKSLAVAGAVLPGSAINVGGLIGSLATGSYHGTLTAAAVGSWRVNGVLTGDVDLSGAGVPAGKPALVTLTVTGDVLGSRIHVGGNVTTFQAATFRQSTLYAGYTGPADGSGTFGPSATVTTFNVTGGASAYQDSWVIASEFKVVSLRSASTATPAGVIAADRISRLTIGSPPTFTYTPLNGDSLSIGSFQVRIV